jgi:hypothetical protein
MTAYKALANRTSCDYDTPPKLSVTGLAMERLSKGSMYRLKDGGGYFRGNGRLAVNILSVFQKMQIP